MPNDPIVWNLIETARGRADAEVVEALLSGGSFRLERIVSFGQATPPGEWYDQAEAEWVVLLSGRAGLRFEGVGSEVVLSPGDAVLIEARRRHRVEWTAVGVETVWVAVHFEAAGSG